MAESLPHSEQRQPWLTFALVGAGPTGVELAGQIRELATRTLTTEFRTINPAEARVLLYDGGGAPLDSFGKDLSARAARTLAQLGVEVHLHAQVTRIDEQGLTVQAEDGTQTTLAARTLFWTAGVVAPAFAHALARAGGAAQERDGRIQVRPDLSLPGHPEIRVVGDAMSLDRLPGVAEVAMQSGWHAAGQVLDAIKGQAGDASFHYRDLGSAAYLCRGHAVVSAGPLRLSGRLGWFVWGFIHLAFLTGYRNRASAVLTWMGTLAAGTRRELVHSAHDVNTGRESYPPHPASPGRPDHVT